MGKLTQAELMIPIYINEKIVLDNIDDAIKSKFELFQIDDGKIKKIKEVI